MAKWEIVFFPSSGEKHSPIDALKNIPRPNDKVKIMRQIELISDLETGDWPHWVKMVDKNYQVTAGDYRVYFNLSGRKMVICHICRKVSQKALKSDLDRARINFINYQESEE
jgi:phage-related protein